MLSEAVHILPRHNKILGQIRNRSKDGKMPICNNLLCQATGVTRMLDRACAELRAAGLIKWVKNTGFTGLPSGWVLTAKGKEFAVDLK